MCTSDLTSSVVAISQDIPGDTNGVVVNEGANKIGGAYYVSGQLIDENSSLRSVSRSFVTATSSGNTQLVAAQGVGVRVRLLSLFVMAASAVDVKFQSATSDISATWSVSANGGFVLPVNEHGWFQTGQNQALNVNLSSNVSVGVQATWCTAT